MKVVFVQDVPSVALEGDIKEVKKGHARNYLFPKGFAVPATAEELKRVEARRRAAAKRREEQMAEAQGIAGTLEGVSLVFAKRVTSKGNIYGSVSNTAIQQELKRLGHDVEKPMIRLEEPIRQLGEHTVEIELVKDVVVPIKVTVEAAEDESKASGEVKESGEEATEEPIGEPAEETIHEVAEQVTDETSEETSEEAVGQIVDETADQVTDATSEETSEEKTAEEN